MADHNCQLGGHCPDHWLLPGQFRYTCLFLFAWATTRLRLTCHYAPSMPASHFWPSVRNGCSSSARSAQHGSSKELPAGHECTSQMCSRYHNMHACLVNLPAWACHLCLSMSCPAVVSPTNLILMRIICGVAAARCDDISVPSCMNHSCTAGHLPSNLWVLWILILQHPQIPIQQTQPDSASLYHFDLQCVDYISGGIDPLLHWFCGLGRRDWLHPARLHSSSSFVAESTKATSIVVVGSQLHHHYIL